MKNQSNSRPDEDFFAVLMEHSVGNVCLLVLSMGFVTFGIPAFYSIVWYEKNSPENSKRTLLNRFVSKGCTSAIEFCILVQVPEIIRLLLGPLPQSFCFFKQVLRTAYFTEFMMLLDAIAVSQFVYIFCLQNPAAFHDEFWCLVIGRSIKLTSLVSQLVWHALASRQPINYYICTGLDPSNDFERPLKVYGIVEIVSIIIHVFVFVKIRIYAMNDEHNNPLTKKTPPKKLLLYIIQKGSLPSFVTNVINITLLALSTIYMTTVTSMDPKSMLEYPNNIFIQFMILGLTSLIGTIGICCFYINHAPLRRAIFKKIMNE